MREPATTSAADDEVLVARVLAGDHDAFAVIVRRHQPAALRLAWSICQSTEEAQDAVQEAFVKAFGGLAGFRSDGRLAPWLMRIVANEARNRRRSTFRWRRRNERDVATTPTFSSEVEHTALVAVDRAGLAEALGRLGARDREVLGCRFIAGLSEAETAEALACPVGTVKSRSARALTRLRAEMGDVRDGH